MDKIVIMLLSASMMTVFGLLVFTVVKRPVLAAVGGHKNVLLLFVDDGGFMQTIYNNSVCDTPNLDALAARSVVLNRGYTSVSSCSPSRSVLLTGLPQHQNGMYGLMHSVHHFQSFDGVKSLPVILQKNGIYTGLIGKYHVAPKEVYSFDYLKINDINQVGRNITNIKILTREFLDKAGDSPFFLYMAFYDTHRGSYKPEDIKQNGPFYNLWGDGEQGHGRIPDWKPHRYDPKDVKVPYFLPDTPATREEIAAMYTSFNRMDQGVGLIMDELRAAGKLEDTLILFTADNGIPFPNAKTNLYEPGIGEPMMISSPLHREHWGKVTQQFGSTIDFTPTILDWFGVEYPRYKLNGVTAKLTGRSLLNLAADPSNPTFDKVFSSHDFHEVTMAYPMRVLRNDRFRLIHNLNNRAPYPMATDLYSCATFQDILRRTKTGQPTKWFKTLTQYYYRDEWELYDLKSDPQELHNLASDPAYKNVFVDMYNTLLEWQEETNDPWRCMPHGVLLGTECHDLMNQPSPSLQQRYLEL